MKNKKSKSIKHLSKKNLSDLGFQDIKYTKGGIPKIIHQIWIGNKDIPILQTLYMNSFRTMNGWNYKLWNNNDLNEKNFPKTWKYIQKAIEISKKTKRNPYAQIADLMRLEIIYKYGGVYVDTTLEPLQNFDNIFTNNDKFVISNEDPCGLDCYAKGKYYISNSFFSSIPKNTILKRSISSKNLDNINFKSKNVNIETGPFYLRKNIKKTDDITLLPMETIYPFGYENKYKKGNQDLCFSYTESPNTNIILKSDKKNIYISYPCKEYPNSFAIKHFEVGGTWK
jgi:mannosyltransferase OCH1-like enzyme